MTNQTNWTEYTGSDEQIAEIGMSVYANGFITRNASGIESNVVCSDTSHYWIIKPDPLREMKVRQATTGQPVYWGIKGSGKFDNWSCDFIPWNKPELYDFSFTEFKD